MTFKHAGEIEANLGRAQQSLEAAQELASGEYYDFVASRAYYAAFYAATALLLSEELTFSRHSGVVASIHQVRQNGATEPTARQESELAV